MDAAVLERDIHETAIILRNEIARAGQLASDVHIHEVFLSAETIISCLAYLISPIAEMEQRYRQKVMDAMLSGSNAKAEAHGKASEEYKEWRKHAALYKLGHEQLMLLKKFRNDLAMEKSNS